MDYEPVRINRKLAFALLPRRDEDGNKGTFGCLLTLCGSRDMTGAAVMSGMAALRCGLGLLAVGAVAPVLQVTKPILWEAVNLPLPETADGRIAPEAAELAVKYTRADAVLAGCGMGRGAGGRALLTSLLEKDGRPMVLDADALNCLADDFPDLRGRAGGVIITPHMGEMSRLTGKTIDELRRDRMGSALAFAREKGVAVVLKDSVTSVAAPDGRCWQLDRPNSGLAKGGSGDVLAGCVGSFLAQGCTPEDAAVLGAAIHSVAGLRAAEQVGKYGMLPRDLLDAIPQVLKEAENTI
ncbi:MAG: NAD(P)H-hydrate dehydratase [Ruminococcaceae bacterium]|nr:NAD(P)H-hydrate dehydratase [Oscillospiraceae bacterium]